MRRFARPTFALQEGKLYKNGVHVDIPNLLFYRYIDSGANAAVFEASQIPLGRKVAVKFWFRKITDKASRALDEAKKLSALTHPLLVSVYDFGVIDSSPYAIMELVNGETLQSWLRQNTRSPKQRYLVWHMYSAALAYIYRSGNLHGDPHSKNVLVYKDVHGVSKPYLLQSALVNGEGLDDIAIKLADVGSSRIWTNKDRFAEREAQIIIETIDRIFPHVPASKYLISNLTFSPDMTRMLCDRYADFATHFDSPIFEIAEWFPHTFLRCPFLDFDKFISFGRQYLSEADVLKGLDILNTQASLALNKWPGDLDFKNDEISTEERSTLLTLIAAYKDEFKKNPDIWTYSISYREALTRNPTLGRTAPSS
jgi:serine/threonine protein kinase